MRRFNFSDIARGLAILYIIQCHVCNYHLAWIDSWAMPVFFVIMGMFFKPTLTWKEMIVKKHVQSYYRLYFYQYHHLYNMQSNYL